ncbi:MAG: ACT domain-containing protein, partial [Candidatus Omnitrophota bacterium]
PMHIRSSFYKEKGTLITKEGRAMEDVLVRGVTVNKDEAKVTICDVPDKPGEASKIFEQLAKSDINVDMIIQNISRTKTTDISFTVTGKDLQKTKKVVNKITERIGAGRVEYNENIAKVSVVGIGMRSHSGVAAKMFNALASKKINIEMISTSEIKISCVVRGKDADKAVNAIHKAFGLGGKKKKK